MSSQRASRRVGSPADRIWGKFKIGDECWEWTASTNKGYGQINGGRAYDNQPLQAHRVVYEVFRGPIPSGLDLDHLCQNPPCVRPDHLEPVTRGENTRRGTAGSTHKARMAALTHCLRGHEFTPENTYIRRNASGSPGRVCRTCHAIRERDRRRSKSQ